MKKILNDAMPILAVSDDGIVSNTGDLTIAFEVTKPEIFTLSPEDYKAIHHCWVKAIGLLPHHTILHMQDWYTESRYKADIDPEEGSPLHRANEAFFEGREHLDHRSYLFLTRRNFNYKASRSLGASFLQKTLIPEELLAQAAVDEFISITQQFERVLTEDKLIRLRRLLGPEISGDRENAGIIEQYYQLSNPGELPGLRDVQLNPVLKIGDLTGVLYTIAGAEDLPPQCSCDIPYMPYSTEQTPLSIGFATPLGLLLRCNHIYNQYLFIEDPQVVLQKLGLKRRRLQSLAQHSRENASTRDSIDEFITDAIEKQKKLVKGHFNIFSWGKTEPERQEIRTKISSAIAKTGATPYTEMLDTARIWWAGIPGNAGALPMHNTFDSFADQAACFLQIDSNYRSTDGPLPIRLGDRISGYPVNINILEVDTVINFNKFCLGGSGSGKSFFLNNLVHTYYRYQSHIVIVDIGNSYRGLCSFVGGTYFIYSEDNPLCFNPFWLPDGEILDVERKETMKALLLALWKKDDEQFIRSEYVALSNALQLYYKLLNRNGDIVPCFNTFYEFLRDEYVQVLADDRVKEKDFDIGNFLYVLRPFYKGGEYDYLLNAEAELDLLHQRFIVYELDQIKNHEILFPVVAIMIIQTFYSKMRQLPGVHKVILIDEAWKAIARPGMEEYIQYVYKTVRKFYGEAITASQEVEDVISSPIVKKAIIGSSATKIVLDLSQFKNSFSDIKALLGLSEQDKALVLSLNKANDPTRRYKEVFIKMGQLPAKAYRTEVSQEEYFTYTTNEKEKVLVKEYADRFQSYQKGIAVLAAEQREKNKTAGL